MKILILTNNDVGLYKFKIELIQSFLKSQHSVYLGLPDGEFIAKFTQLGCTYINVELERRGKNPFKDIKLFSKYMHVIKNVHPDICITYTIKPNIYGGLAARLSNIPTLTNITGLGSGIENKGLMKELLLKMYKISIKKAKYVFFENRYNMEVFKRNKIIHNNAILLPGSGVNLNDYSFENYPIDNGIVRFLFIGRIMKEKGINEFLECASIIKKKYKFVFFEIVGSFEEDYKDIINGFVEQGIVIYHGFQNDIKYFIKNSHAIILPSYHEGLSNVLLESAAMGRPLITTNIPGCKEVVDDELTGYLCNVADTDDLIKKVEKFILLPYFEKESMGIKARELVVNNFSRDIIIEKYRVAINATILGD